MPSVKRPCHRECCAYHSAHDECSHHTARAAASLSEKTFCIGSSLLNPCKPFMDLWYKVNASFPGYRLHIVPFEDDHQHCIPMSREHRLASKKRLRIEDLYGETLMMVKQGDSDTVDAIRAEILKHPQIHIADAPQFYDIEVFNQCEQSQNLMVTIECWKDVHPALVTLPVDWDHPIPYGILYAKEPDADVTHFIETVKKAQGKNM